MYIDGLEKCKLHRRLINVYRLDREWFAKYHDSDLSIPSQEFEALCNVATKSRVHLSLKRKKAHFTARQF